MNHAEFNRTLRDHHESTKELIEAMEDDMSETETGIRNAYHAALADCGEPGAEWVDLADLRRRLPRDFARVTVDRVLDQMIELSDVWLMAELNRATLTPQRQDAAVVIGDEPRHLMKIGPA